jgi:hypothetical protein
MRLTVSSNDHLFFTHVPWDNQIEAQVGEWRLKACSRWDVQVEDELLDRLFDLTVVQTIVSDEGGEQGVEVRKSYRTRRLTLQSENEIDDLTEGASEVLGWLAGYLAFHTGETFHEQIFQAPADTVNGQRTKIVYVQIPVHVRRTHFLGIDLFEPIPCHDGGVYVVVQTL